MVSSSVAFCQMVSDLEPSHSHRVGPSVTLVVHHTEVPTKGSAGHGISLCVGECHSLPVLWASVGSALGVALLPWLGCSHSSGTLAICLQVQFLQLPIIPNSGDRGFIHVHHNNQKALGIYDKISDERQ